MLKIETYLKNFLSPNAQVLFYPSCGCDNIYPELFKLNYDLFVFSDGIGHRQGQCAFSELRSLTISERETLDYKSLNHLYKQPELNDINKFWDSFRSKLPKLSSSVDGDEGFVVQHAGSNCIAFKVFGKQAVLFFWDNNITLTYLQEMGFPIKCFIGVNDGCQEGYNYECVNSINWLKRVMSSTLDSGLLYITDHREGCNGSEHADYGSNFTMSGYNVTKVTQKKWMQDNKLSTNPLPPFFHSKDDLDILLITNKNQ